MVLISSMGYNFYLVSIKRFRQLQAAEQEYRVIHEALEALMKSHGSVLAFNQVPNDLDPQALFKLCMNDHGGTDFLHIGRRTNGTFIWNISRSRIPALLNSMLIVGEDCIWQDNQSLSYTQFCNAVAGCRDDLDYADKGQHFF